jgi:hypothetical protein
MVREECGSLRALDDVSAPDRILLGSVEDENHGKYE